MEMGLKENFILKLHPCTKLVWTIWVISLVFMTDNIVFIAGIIGIDLIVALGMGKLKMALNYLYKLIIFAMVLILFQIFFIPTGEIIFYVIPSMGWLPITDIGLRLSVMMAVRMIAMVLAIPIFIQSTSTSDLAVFMTGQLKVPVKYTFIFTTTLRFIPLLSKRMEQIMQAQRARGLDLDTRNPIKKLMVVVPLGVPLLVGSIRNAEQMAMSMEVRGFGRQNKRTFYKEMRIHLIDYVIMGLMVGSVLLVAIHSLG